MSSVLSPVLLASTSAPIPVTPTYRASAVNYTSPHVPFTRSDFVEPARRACRRLNAPITNGAGLLNFVPRRRLVRARRSSDASAVMSWVSRS
ncbi:hypothetical protein, partial [Paraburkholderia ginsengiterrae]|uniref:hypothetical protein n=1 Tax=Paraburkholderia ginsengiterrae TaxID=1462993 RepID=UPI001ABFB32A